MRRRIAFYGDSLTAGLPGCSYLALLRARFPEHALLGRGRPNETVASLRHRLATATGDGRLDLAFLWIGVNDLPGQRSTIGMALARLARQPPARDLAELRRHYAALLELLRRRAPRTVAVSPSIAGEDLDGPANRYGAEVGRAVAELVAGCPGAEYLDLRPRFEAALAAPPAPVAAPTDARPRPARILLDALLLRDAARADRAASARGLRLTIDGVHLSGAGARLVAEALAGPIERLG
jgi:lysophospholipase L1-like esterase